MATLIKNRRIVPDSWQRLEPAAEGGVTGASFTGDCIVPFAAWREQRTQWIQRVGGDVRCGVLLENTDDARVLTQDFDKLALIAVRFPKFTDGRGYSIARELRRLGWQGELRAVGDVLRDQLFYLSRCGFDAFELREDQDGEAALSAFDDFSAPYQSAEDNGARFGGLLDVAGQPRYQAANPW
jgi:uncharacterized protein (DUF934 family)